MRTIEASSSAFVYLQRNPSPISNPVSGQCHENRGLCSSASQKANIAASQKKIDKGSIVIRNAPMLKIGVTFNASTAQIPALALNNRRAKYYELTRRGQKQLEVETDSWRKLTAAITQILESV